MYCEEKVMSPLLLCVVLATSPPDLGMEGLAAPAERDPATLTVTLPADAKLTFDGQATLSTSAHRLFITPPLEKGKSFRYSVKAEFIRAGRTITVQQEISVQAGRDTFVSIDIPREAFSNSYLPGEYAYVYGAGREARPYYYSPEASAAATRVIPARPVLQHLSRTPSSGGFHPLHWGPDPSDPFYHSGQ
jgi:uncharacterized protein (TIGR03000 family)